MKKYSEGGEFIVVFGVKSCATNHCPTPSGPEGSNGQQNVLCDAGKLDLYCFYGVPSLRALPLAHLTKVNNRR